MLKASKSMDSQLQSNRIKRRVGSVPELEWFQRVLEDEYTDAYQTGKEGKCWMRYSCPLSLFKILPRF